MRSSPIFKTLQHEVLLDEIGGRLAHTGDELTYLGKIIMRTKNGYELRPNGKGVDTAVVCYKLEQEAVPLPSERCTTFRMKLDRWLALSHDRADVPCTMMIAKYAATNSCATRYLVKFLKILLSLQEAEFLQMDTPEEDGLSLG